VRISHAY